MKITVQVIVEAALAIILAICCLVTYFSGMQQREVGSAYRQARIAMAGKDKTLLTGGAEAPVPDNAVEPLERLVKLCPNEYGLQMTLVGLYLRPRSPEFGKAKPLCEKIASEANPDKVLRAMAMVHLGMLEGREATNPKAQPEMRAPGLAAAKRWFEQALALDDRAGDAYAGLGLVALWDGKTEDAERNLNEALKTGRQMGIEVIPEVHNALGLVAAAKGNMPESRARFEAAEQLKKSFGAVTKAGGEWPVPAANLRSIEEGTVGIAKMDPAVRRKLLAPLDERLKNVKAPPQRLALLNPVGCGYFYLGEFAIAAARLEEAVKIDPARADLLVNLMATRCATLNKCREVAAETARQAVGKAADSVEGKAAAKARAELAAAEAAFDRMAGDYLAKGAPSPEVEAAVVLTWAELRLRAAAAAAAEKDKAKADKLAAEVDKLLADALAKFPDEPRMVRLAGIRDLAAGRVKEALEKFGKSLAKDAAQPDLRAIADEFAKPLEIVSFRPATVGGKTGPILASTPKPLLGVLFRTNTGPIPLAPEKVRLLLDGTPQQGIFWGTEYLSMPEKELPDGEHLLVAEGEDAMGHKAKSELRFLVDVSPPEIVSTEPADGKTTKGPRPLLAVTFKDKYSGVDPTSVEIEIRTSKAGAQTLLTDFPVRGGRYTYSYDAMNMKKGAMAGEDKFVFTTTRDLGAGTYDVTVSVGDQRGAKMPSKTWSFVIVE
jgi:tetratricopeptide (TPR) repeat protein